VVAVLVLDAVAPRRLAAEPRAYGSTRGRRGGREASRAGGGMGDERMGFEDRDRVKWFDRTVT
jgi:hypothetical protein